MKKLLSLAMLTVAGIFVEREVQATLSYLDGDHEYTQENCFDRAKALYNEKKYEDAYWEYWERLTDVLATQIDEEEKTVASKVMAMCNEMRNAKNK